MLRRVVEDAIYGSNSNFLQYEPKKKSSRVEKPQSQSDLAEFVFYSDRKPRYFAGTKLRRKIYQKLEEEEFLLKGHVKEIVNDFLHDLPASSNDINTKKKNILQHEVFTCKCGWLLYDPTTLPCGHTCCKHCVEENMFCLECGYTLTSSCKVSPLLVEVLSTWFETLYSATKLKLQTKNFFASNQFTEALSSINDALTLVGEDFTALNLRVETSINLQKYKAALQDAELSCKINSTNGKSHYIRALCHVALKDVDQAIDAFQVCLELDPEDSIQINDVITNLSKVFAVDVHENEIDVKKKLGELEGLDTCSNDGAFDHNIQASEKSMHLLEMNVNDGENTYKHLCVSKLDSESLHPSNCIDNTIDQPSEIQAATSESKCTFKGVPCHLINEEVFECKLCYDLLFKPVTMTCGHVFCKTCLVKTLDYNALCPICRLELSDYKKDPMKPVTVVIEDILQIFLKEQFMKRNEEYATKMDKLSRVGIDENVEHPIFVCSIAFPGVECPLHIFEPKYRQMIRDCLESGGCRFGMCSPNKDDEYSNLGTILTVTNYELLDDGRFIIHTVAGKRFEVKEKFLKDSLHYAKVTYFEDDEEDSNSEEFSKSTKSAYDDLATYINSLQISERDVLFNALGKLPTYEKDTKAFPDGLPWVWWGLAALPLNFTAKLALLRSKCVTERLGSLQRFLRFLSR